MNFAHDLRTERAGRRWKQWRRTNTIAFMIPSWLHAIAITSLVVALACAVIIVVDEIRHPQHMWIMNVVWPLTALFGSLLALWGYWAYGRAGAGEHAGRLGKQTGKQHGARNTPFTVVVAKGTTHCGAGCCLGDIIAEWLAFLVPTVATWFGWRTLFEEKMFAVWILDYIFAFALGIGFQYFAIQPMRHLAAGQALRQAVKADALSLTAWQTGMYVLMAAGQFLVFRRLLGVRLEVDTPEFWFLMQIAMLAGFATSYPVNWWLIRARIKEAM